MENINNFIGSPITNKESLKVQRYSSYTRINAQNHNFLVSFILLIAKYRLFFIL
ncbi:hypothetical protein Fleli_0437 [Bernardetia litoralis DSM 6794]|uniref:Uncharacterized protein n=1 Tax=Bernardetia litoralis (strain ATCC 23117 / DSM 6794 / NBRC 15988 / NCIMB 1366 / Fx l1 / Sio-4) TaxID=880071 RepID=I4AG28_BERLS|nr:hypothetical protein Fleli_0437 [Bernardetia litoralis DSM 6794]